MKKTFVFLMVIFLMIGACGCMGDKFDNQVDREIKAQLMQYANTEYNREFEEVFYETAIDATQNYVLCLRDAKGRIFNVYEDAETGERRCDYKNSIVDYKMRDFLSEYLDIKSLNGSISAMAIMNIGIEIDELEKMTAQECIEKFGLYSLIFVYQFEGEKGSIEKNANVILDIYSKLQKLDTTTIDFNVVVTTDEAAGVQNVMNNMQYKYSGDWYSYEEVQEYICAANPALTNKDALISLVEE